MSDAYVLQERAEAKRFLMLMGFSVFACFVYGLRYEVAGAFRFKFLLWNLMLAWVPYGMSCVMLMLFHRHKERFLWPLAIGWLLFFPNAPYILTDLMHIARRGNVLWFDTLMITTFAIHGLVLGLMSLRHVHHMIRSKLSAFWTHIVLFMITCLSGYAIYIGRFLRWNSWDLFTRPWRLFGHLYHDFFIRGRSGLVLKVSLICAGTLFFCYILLSSFDESASEEQVM
ncbi:MAG TPA: hypothetical protein DCE42_02750 [Myxococcales bacterium]|nr:hypothetical protein [Deltaproteobacteria bacterium]MBU53044.1 hypothetical protein [Deltaproteobacteria bacterium]HAA53644.1 hypothetical protein [Myxococcales bacterium]